MLCLRWIEPYSCCLLWITFFYMLEPTWLLVINNWGCNLFHIGRSVLRQNTVWVPKLSLGKKSNIQCFFVICYHLMNFEITYSWLVVSMWLSSCSALYWYCISCFTVWAKTSWEHHVSYWFSFIVCFVFLWV